MAEIRTVVFHGMRTALHNTLQPGGGAGASFADVANNTRLKDGSLQAMRGDRLVETLSFAAKTIAKLPSFTCCAGLYALPYCGSVIEAPPVPCCPCENHIIAFSSECCDKHKRCNPCSGECWPLCVDAPTLPLTARLGTTTMLGCGHSVTSSCTPLSCASRGSSRVDIGCNVKSGKGPDETAYLYTYVDEFGVESSPSPPTQPITKWDDQPVTLGRLPTVTPPNAVAMRIYRAVRDYPVGQDPLTQNASYQLVVELALPLATTTFVDNIRLCNLPGDVLQTMENCPPPACMEQVHLLDSGYYVGFTCDELLFSERHEPWNWPERYKLRFPDKIVGIAVLGDVIFVGTTGTPYRVKVMPAYGGINDGLPNQERIQSFDTKFDVQQFPEKYPCLAKDTMVATSFGAMYATHRGLVSLRVDAGNAMLMSKQRIDEERWREIVPNRAVWHDGHYIGYRGHNGKGFIYEVPSDGRSMEFGDLVAVDLGVSLLHAGRDGRLYGVNGQNVVALFEANTLRQYTWRSRLFRASSYTNMGAAKVVGEYGSPVTFTIYAGGRKLFSKQVYNSRPFRLPRHCRATDFVVEVSGTTTVTELHVGPNLRSLSTDSQSTGNGQGQGDAA